MVTSSLESSEIEGGIDLAKIVKSISLDERTAPIAAAKDNFSAWVREQLLSEIAYSLPCSFFPMVRRDHEGKELERKEEVCNGQKVPTCEKCYPNGKPNQADWLDYARWIIDLEELHERTDEEWKWRTDLRARKKERAAPSKKVKDDANTPPSRHQKKYVRRLIRWIWGYI